jgi:uncharacterized protein
MVSRRTFLQTASLAGLAICSTPSIFAEEGDPLILKTFNYNDISLAPGLAQTQFEETQAVLLSLNVDSILKPWRLRAGLPAPGPDLGGWYDEVPLDKTESGGHGFAPAHSTGQWISALSRGYAITGDQATRTKVLTLLDLYGPAISGKFYTNFRFPAYDYDKMVIGLVDAHRYANVPQALTLLDRTTDAAEPHLPPTALDRDDPQKRWRTQVGDNTTNDYLWDESYTMPENLYIASQQGGGERYRKMAARYLLDKTYFQPLSENMNVLPNHHAYSFCNALSSAMQAYIVTGSKMHRKAASNAFDMITAAQSFATGGWGPNESFVEPGTGALYKSLSETHRGFETPCGSYAHFKLTRYLLQITGDGRYGDSMERVLYNTVLGAKRLERDGHAFYYSDYNTNASRTYFPDAWPCCSGTLPQVAADYRILTYFHDVAGVYVNLYLPSTVKWTNKDGALASLTQSGSYPLDSEIKFSLKLSRPSEFAIRLRIPAWSNQAGAALIRVNGSRVPVTVQSGFATLRRKWNNNDRIELDIPLPMRLEAIDSQHPNMVALVRGPLVLFALTKETPHITRNQLLSASRVPGRDMWTAQTTPGAMKLAPFTSVGDASYRTYLDVS